MLYPYIWSIIQIIGTNAMGTNAKRRSDSGPFSYAELVKRDEVSLDIFWLKDGNRLDADLLNETAGNDAFRCSHEPRLNLTLARIVKAVSLGYR